jgi:hypothetical protein
MSAERTTQPHRPARCRGAKAVRGPDRGAAAALFRRRSAICRDCDVRDGCYVAHQPLCSRRRIWMDARKFCPADPPRW